MAQSQGLPAAAQAQDGPQAQPHPAPQVQAPPSFPQDGGQAALSAQAQVALAAPDA